jgi:hypothetical protein
MACARAGQDIDVKVYGRKSGYITYRRNASGLIEKTYVDFSDDGQNSYSGNERMEVNPRGHSTYTARVKISGVRPGTMDLKITFGPLGGNPAAQIIFTPDETGTPLTHGYVEYGGQRLTVDTLSP